MEMGTQPDYLIMIYTKGISMPREVRLKKVKECSHMK